MFQLGIAGGPFLYRLYRGWRRPCRHDSATPSDTNDTNSPLRDTGAIQARAMLRFIRNRPTGRGA